MRIEELSVGDWVEVLIANKARVSKVEGIRWNDQIRKYVVEVCNGAFRLQDCYILPIPLTSEILEKNGVHFVENFGDDEYLFACPMFSVIHLKGRDEWKFCVPNAWLYIRSVHQLQHALRLAGIEKEIEV